MKSTISFSARFTPDEEKVWKHVPFTVPDDVSQFHISITYNDRIDSSPMLSGGNTLDIGLFDTQGIESGSPGLRGWSGSNKTEITIGEAWSTPPYRAGRIQPGEWNLLLGAYKTCDKGLLAEVTVEFNSSFEIPVAPDLPDISSLKRQQLPPVAEAGWYRGDMHMHTIYSDGDSYPHELAVRAYQIGLDFYGITDHNRAQSPVSLVPHGDGWPVMVPGVEVTSYAGHFNAWGGSDSWYDFRDYSAAGQQAAVDAALADGALVSMNHPKPFGPMWEHPEIAGFACTEPWNGWWGSLNNLATSFWNEQLDQDSAENWHIGVCGSDTHRLKTPGTAEIPVSPAAMGWPTMWLHIEQDLSPDSILAAIRSGTGFMSESPAGPQIYVNREADRIRVRLVGAGGNALVAIGTTGCIQSAAVSSEDQAFEWTVDEAMPHGNAYVRFEVHAAGGTVRALSNPVWR